MAIIWEKANRNLIEIAEQVIRDDRPYLVNARIGFLFRSEPGSSQGRPVIGKAQKVPARLQPLLDLDFIIWISKPDWLGLDLNGRRALMLHELCHCEIDSDTEETSIRAHDIEEFHYVIKKYGLWREDIRETARVIQPHLPGLERKGRLEALEPEKLPLEMGAG